MSEKYAKINFGINQHIIDRHVLTICGDEKIVGTTYKT